MEETMTIATAADADLDTGLTEHQVIRKVAWRLMPLIMVCYLFAFFDRINISFAKFQLQSRSRPQQHRLRLSARACSSSATCCSKCRAT